MNDYVSRGCSSIYLAQSFDVMGSQISPQNTRDIKIKEVFIPSHFFFPTFIIFLLNVTRKSAAFSNRNDKFKSI